MTQTSRRRYHGLTGYSLHSLVHSTRSNTLLFACTQLQQEIVNKLKESHATFDKKTAYSQAKYLQKKGKKFHKVFTPIKPTAYSVNEYFYVKNPSKIRDIRMDTLSQLLSYSNVHSGCKLLVVDDTQGMIVSALAERMGGREPCFQIFAKDLLTTITSTIELAFSLY